MSGIWLPGVAVTISLFLLIFFFCKKNYQNQEVNIYQHIIILNFFFSINALAVYIVSKTIEKEIIIGFMQKIHLSLLLLIGFYLFFYILVINNLKKNHNDFIVKIAKMFTSILIAAILICPVKVINYDEILDVGGTSYIICMIGIIIYFILIIILNIRYFFKENKK